MCCYCRCCVLPLVRPGCLFLPCPPWSRRRIEGGCVRYGPSPTAPIARWVSGSWVRISRWNRSKDNLGQAGAHEWDGRMGRGARATQQQEHRGVQVHKQSTVQTLGGERVVMVMMMAVDPLVRSLRRAERPSGARASSLRRASIIDCSSDPAARFGRVLHLAGSRAGQEGTPPRRLVQSGRAEWSRATDRSAGSIEAPIKTTDTTASCLRRRARPTEQRQINGGCTPREGGGV